LKAAGLVGNDMHKPGQPPVAEMGGIAIVLGLVGATLLGIYLHAFFGFEFRLSTVMAALLTVTIMALIGIFDDLFDMRQSVKAFLPLAAAVPLIAVEMAGGNSAITIPFIGAIQFGILYPILLVPLAIAVCSNLTNMMAGFNGVEAGLGIVMFATLAIVAFLNGQVEMTVLCTAMLGALMGFIPFNWYPAKTFIGDVGALTIGAVLASAVIISNLKAAGAILVIPYVIDFFLKAANRFPKSFAHLGKDGKLRAPPGKIRGLADLILTVTGGLTEKGLTMAFLGIEMVFAAIVLVMYGHIV
jgi:UDP-N-acetylglucosamine--dolichyl-phosphate N-acetylglucosaminephosphotransferase